MSKNDDYKEHQDCGCSLGSIQLLLLPCSGHPKSTQQKYKQRLGQGTRYACSALSCETWPICWSTVGPLPVNFEGDGREPLENPELSHVHILHVQVSQVYGKSLGVISKHTKNQWKSQMLTEKPNGIPLFNIMFNILIENPDWNSNFHGSLFRFVPAPLPVPDQ